MAGAKRPALGGLSASLGVVLVSASLVGFCGSRALPASAPALVAGVVRSVLAAGRGVAVGCALGADAAVLSSALRAGAASRLSVFAAFGPVSPAFLGSPAPHVRAPGASRSCSSVSGVAEALAAGAPVSWWSGGGPAVPLRSRLAARSAALVSAVAASSPAGRGFVGFVSSRPCPAGLLPSRSRSACFSGSGSGSWASLAFAAGLGLPLVVFPLGSGEAPAPVLPASWGSWVPCAGAFSGGFRLSPASPPLL